MINKKEIIERLTKKFEYSLEKAIDMKVFNELEFYHVKLMNSWIKRIIGKEIKKLTTPLDMSQEERLKFYTNNYYELFKEINDNRIIINKILYLNQESNYDQIIDKIKKMKNTLLIFKENGQYPNLKLVQEKNYYKKRYEELIKEKIKSKD